MIGRGVVIHAEELLALTKCVSLKDLDTQPRLSVGTIVRISGVGNARQRIYKIRDHQIAVPIDRKIGNLGIILQIIGACIAVVLVIQHKLTGAAKIDPEEGVPRDQIWVDQVADASRRVKINP